MIDNHYWHEKWKSQEIGFNQLAVNSLLQRYLPEFDLNKGCQIFLPLCGKSIDMLWLMEQSYHVVGVEISEIACDAFFHENGLSVTKEYQKNFIVYKSQNITLFCGDFFNLNHEHLATMSMIYDRAALIALPKRLRKKYADHLIKLSVPNTKMLLITTSYDQKTMDGPPFSVNEHEVAHLYGQYFMIRQCYHKLIQKLPLHLKIKGLEAAYEQAYYLSRL